MMATRKVGESLMLEQNAQYIPKMVNANTEILVDFLMKEMLTWIYCLLWK